MDDVGMELIRNDSFCYVQKEHMGKFDNKYIIWRKSGAVLNFDIFAIKEKGILYDAPGNKLLKSNVSTSLITKRNCDS
jgi:hypothetical protein